MIDLDSDGCYRACLARDPRFDGRFFIAVRTTGIYCRPVCPAPKPKRRNVSFFASSAAAAAAGFRPCLRCHPELAPDSPGWNGTGTTIRRALRLIDGGILDRQPVEALAARLGVGSRHLRRLFIEQIGATPVAIGQNRRLLFAKQLIDQTALPMSQVALASGFKSVRRFNTSIRETFRKTPTELRGSVPAPRAAAGAVELKLSYRPPLDWSGILEFLAPRAIPGVEVVSGAAYRRTVRVGSQNGVVEVEPGGAHHLRLRARGVDPLALPHVIRRVRDLFDLDADPLSIDADLGRHCLLSTSVKQRPGIRVPGAFDPFELAVRAVLGQQVTVKGATTLSGRLVATFGEPVAHPAADELSHLFPTPAALSRGKLYGLGLTGARAATLLRLAADVDQRRLVLAGDALDPQLARRGLHEIPGIGDWTVEYIAMRAFRDPDAFPSGDLGLQRAAGADGERPSAALLRATAEPWRPWRAYAAMHLWSRLQEHPR